MNQSSSGLVGALVGLPIFEAEWVLWLLIVLSLISVAIMVERWIFFRSHSVDIHAIRLQLNQLLGKGDYSAAADYLAKFDSLETNVVLFGLREYKKGPDAVEDLLTGAESLERLRYSKRLGFLATVGSNAPFIGLFGTVLGIIRAFRDLSENMADASGSVMSGISEALVATAVGLLVAIPAVIAYNVYVAKVKEIASNGSLLSKTLLSQLKAEDAPGGAG
jgi:biopolymer transport protein ExbB